MTDNLRIGCTRNTQFQNWVTNMAKAYDKNKVLPIKGQEKLISQATDTIRRYVDHWNPLYTGAFRDYRTMAARKMPDSVMDKLKANKYTGKAKLVPGLIADHIEAKTTSVMNNTLNRNEPFKFAGQDEKDQPNAENGRKLVMYNWQFTNFKMEARKAVRDAGIVGTGWMVRSHYVDRRLRRDFGGADPYVKENFDEVYIGPRFHYRRAEMMYPEPKPPGLDFNRITSIVEIFSLPITAIRKEGVNGGLFEKYRSNIKNILKEDYKPDSETKFSLSDDHSTGESADIETDFKVLVANWWTSLLDIYGNETPAWHRTTIANWETNPQLLACDIDPMGNGKHPFYCVTMFDPPEPRLNGASLTEKLYNIFLENFYKRNQRIDLINRAAKRAGLLIGPRSSFPTEFIEANKDLLVFSSDGRGITALPIELGAYQHMMMEEEKTEKDADSTARTNPVTRGLTAQRRETATTTATLDQNAKEQTLDPIAMIEQTLIIPAAEDSHEHNLILVPEPYIGRVLGSDRQPQFFSFSRRDILGRFDAICLGSSEVTPKALKLANLNAMVDRYSRLPVEIDWGKVAKRHWEMAEFGEDVVITTSIQDDNIQRENEAMADGVTWLPLPHEDHQRHIGGHQQYIRLLMSKGMTKDDEGMVAIMMHIKMHLQLMGEQQGALAQQGQAPSYENMGELLDRTNTDNMARVGM